MAAVRRNIPIVKGPFISSWRGQVAATRSYNADSTSAAPNQQDMGSVAYLSGRLRSARLFSRSCELQRNHRPATRSDVACHVHQSSTHKSGLACSADHLRFEESEADIPALKHNL